MTETWLHKNNVYLYHIENFNHGYIIRNNKTGGGVSLFITKNLNYILRNYINLSPKYSRVAIEIYKERFEVSLNTVFVSIYRHLNSYKGF